MENLNGIKIAFAPDDKYTKLAVVAMISILENTKSDIEFIILYSSLSDKSKEQLNFVTKYPNCKLILKQVDDESFKDFNPAAWTTIQTWYRTMLADLLPNAEKIIYLDCDTLARKDIIELWNTDVSNHLIAATQDVIFSELSAQDLHMKSASYFNAGVMLINIRKWREQNLFTKIKNCYKKHFDVKCADQDILNMVIDNDKIVLSPKFNYLEQWWNNCIHGYNGNFAVDYENSKNGDAVIVHFAGYKPTNPKTRNSYKDDWWKYAKLCPFYYELLENYRTDADKYIKKFSNQLNQGSHAI